MTKNINNKITEILNDKPSENSKLDYKVIEYDMSKSGNKPDLIKDVLSMLNSLESYGEDKFIILGVTDKKYIKGLNNMSDDNHYQDLFNEYINPRPEIETGVINYSDKIIGYIYIYGNNIEVPYEVKKETKFKDHKNLTEGTSFIRKSSVNYPLFQEDREKLILKRSEKNPSEMNLFNIMKVKYHAINELYNINKKSKGKHTIDTSSNNGEFTIGEKTSRFTIKFQAASNDIARIYNYSDNILVARKENYKKDQNFQDIEKISITSVKNLDFSSNVQDFTINDLGLLINKHNTVAIISFTRIESKSHGKEKDLIEFKWQLLTNHLN
ncbi:helix-turn-helix domain-containing protein [Staphylococcus equorum]|uniref:AlbA family DNA-binding domain-containing protein n=1 Tax=Staphylococcus equorum TaxID=246432 RepID=UPI003CE94D9F